MRMLSKTLRVPPKYTPGTSNSRLEYSPIRCRYPKTRCWCPPDSYGAFYCGGLKAILVTKITEKLWKCLRWAKKLIFVDSYMESFIFLARCSAPSLPDRAKGDWAKLMPDEDIWTDGGTYRWMYVRYNLIPPEISPVAVAGIASEGMTTAPSCPPKLPLFFPFRSIRQAK